MSDAASPSTALAPIPRRDPPISPASRCDQIAELAQALPQMLEDAADAGDIPTTST
jgi:hypothetical protein